jgi:V8-like Glu-specific endopeptidase
MKSHRNTHLVRAALPALLLTLGTLSACGPASYDETGAGDQATATEDSALVNGIATNNRPEIGQYFRNGHVCTATLILPRYVLTAGHCSDYSNTLYSGEVFQFRDIGGALRSYTVSAIHVFGPVVTPTGSTLYADALPAGIGENDVALLQLSSAVPASQATPATIADAQPANGSRVTQFGYGCTSRTTGGGGYKQYLSWNYASGTTNNCPGDSGGPLVLGNLGDNGAIWGVNSAISGGGSDMFGNVVWFKEQILGVIRGWEGTLRETGVNRPGSDIGVIDLASGATAADCAQQCQANAACRAYTYVVAGAQAANPRCWLKYALPGWVPNPNVVSGSTLDTESNMNRGGQDYSAFDLAQARPELCKAACARDAACAAYTYVVPGAQSTNARCWLKQGVPGQASSTSTTSGVRRGFEANVNRSGQDLRNLSTGNAAACSTECAEDAACKAFTWVASSGKCWLKSAVPGPTSGSGLTSGVKKGLEMNVNRGGQDLRHFTLSTGAPEACQAECEKDSQCVAFTYVAHGLQDSSPVCWLKTGIPAPSSVPGVVSGLRGMSFF